MNTKRNSGRDEGTDAGKMEDKARCKDEKGII